MISIHSEYEKKSYLALKYTIFA